MTKTVNAYFDDLQIDLAEIYLQAGYGHNTPDKEVSDIIDSMLLELKSVCKPCFSYVIADGSVKNGVDIQIGYAVFKPGRIISGNLDQATEFGLFLSTVGVEFDLWKKDIEKQGDMLLSFLADSVGSVLAESVVQLCIDDIKKENEPERKVSNNYSPGYCGWNLRDQQKMFGFFPEGCCGVHLTDSFLMQPVKSVTGVLGIGSNIEKTTYGCAICNMKNCYKNKHK